MLFTNIGLVDENFCYRSNMFVGTIGDRIRYIGDKYPDDDALKAAGIDPEAALDEAIAASGGHECCCHKPEKSHKIYGEEFDGRGKILMPGFYNAHAHSAMTLMRGYGENLPLSSWLNDRIFPFEDKITGEAAYWATLLAMAESMRFGIISTSDQYFFIDEMVRAVSVSGLKMNVSRGICAFDNPNVSEIPAYREMRESIMMYDGFLNGKIRTDASVHAEYTNNAAAIRTIAETAKEFDVGVQIHVAETESETRGCIERHGKTPVEFLESLGLFDQPTNAAHCIWLTDNDRDILAAKGVTVSCNPVSNMKLASGICEVPKLYEKGINVAIGTDGVASNNSLNFFEEIKMFALIGKISSMDAAAMTPQQVLYSATRAGALSQGRLDCGLVKEGFKADLIVVDVTSPNFHPAHDPLNGLVYSADGKDVCMTMCDGEVVYRDGEYKKFDIEKVIAETETAVARILASL